MYKQFSKILRIFFIAFLFFISTSTIASASSEAIKKPLSFEDVVGVLTADEAQLRFIANAIFNRERSVTFLATKTCTHGGEICDFWQRHTWKTMSAAERVALKEQIAKMKGASLPTDLDTDDVVSILRRPSFFMLSPEVLASYMDLGNRAIERGTIEIDISPLKKRCGIKILFKSDRPIGTILQKVDGVEESGTSAKPTHSLMITFDIQDIIEKMIRQEAWDPATDGTVTTLCPTAEVS